MQIARDAHPLLDARAFVTHFPASQAELPTPPWLVPLLALEAAAPLTPDEAVRTRIRDMLRAGGYKPTGRGKPASEYLVRAAQGGALRSVNLAVDACNAVSLHAGLPISVVDSARLQGALHIACGAEGADYVFNASGQVIDVSGLLCLFDAGGPCANAVKDAQRTKTSAETRSTLSIVWSAGGLEQRTDAALAWYRELLERAGARVEAVHVVERS